MHEQGTVRGGGPVRTTPGSLPPSPDVERMVGLVVEAATTRALIWFEADEAADVGQDTGMRF